MQSTMPRRSWSFPLRSLIVLAIALSLAPQADAATRLGTRPLRAGMHGGDVRELQRLLRAVGYPIAVDGGFGRVTARRVLAFRRGAGLGRSRLVNRVVVRALRKAQRGGPGDRRELGFRVLRRGLRGHDIRVLQAALTRVGHAVRGDAEFGAQTRAAVRALEREQGRRPDGVMTRTEQRLLHATAHSETANPQTAAPPESAAPAPLQPAGVPVTSAEAVARVGSDGLASIPVDAPQPVKDVIAAGNRIAAAPYRYGGGHGSFDDSAYDCSGSVSFALRGGNLIEAPLASPGFVSWGASGSGRWITIYTRASHMYMVVAGLRFDTSARAEGGSRWTRTQRSTDGYAIRHPAGL